MGGYDIIAKHYRFLYADWAQSARRQSRALGSLLAANGAAPGAAVLDCACGIGTQALGLAEQGYRLSCSDPSGRSVAELRREAGRRRLAVETRVCAFGGLQGSFASRFRAVIACDNAVPHLLAPQAVSDAAREMHGFLEQGGVLIVSTRDYDSILEKKPAATEVARHEGAGGPRVTFQLWSWHKDEPVYDFELFLLLERRRAWKTVSMKGSYRAWKRAELSVLFREAGFSQCRWLMPEESGYFQPVMVARKEE